MNDKRRNFFLVGMQGGGLPSKLPSAVSGLTRWGDAGADFDILYTDAGTTKASAGDALVYRIGDMSGGNRNMDQSTEGARGLLKLNVQNGRRGVLADGLDDQYVGAAISNFFSADGMTMFFVSMPTDIAADTGAIYNNDPFWCDVSGYIGLHTKGATAARFYNFDANADETASLTIAINNAYLFTVWHTGGTIYAQVNNGTPVSVASGNTFILTGALNFFRRAALATKMGGYYFADAAYNVYVGDSDRVLLNNYFMQRWGLL